MYKTKQGGPRYNANAYEDLKQNDWEQFKKDLRNQPIGIAFAAADPYLFYSGNIYDGPCAAGLNHGMVATGYGVENKVEYVIIRNSWAERWGEKGYSRVAVGKTSGGTC